MTTVETTPQPQADLLFAALIRLVTLGCIFPNKKPEQETKKSQTRQRHWSERVRVVCVVLVDGPVGVCCVCWCVVCGL